MRYYGSLCSALLIYLMIPGCSSENGRSSSKDYQAITALGDTLYAPQIDPETESQFKIHLKKVRSQYQADPGNARKIIRYGRRTASLGDYQKAIAIFNEGIEKHPGDARMYLHRGHFYIIVRRFEKATTDLEKAADLMKGNEIYNAEHEKPLKTQKNSGPSVDINIWYYLGLAYYLKGDFESAARNFRNCLEASPDDEMQIASSYWLYMALRRAGKDDIAGKILEPVRENMEIRKNKNYFKLLLVFKGNFDEKSLLSISNTSTHIENAAIGYGIGNWHYINGRERKAYRLWNNVYSGNSRTAFGYIASEMELARNN